MPLSSIRWLLPVALVVYLLVESYAFTSLSQGIGFFPAFLLAVLKPVGGVLFVMARAKTVFAGLRGSPGGLIRLSSARLSRALLGAVLLVVPGFVSGAVGLVLLWPPAFPGARPRPPADPGLVELDATQWRETSVTRRDRIIRPDRAV